MSTLETDGRRTAAAARSSGVCEPYDPTAEAGPEGVDVVIDAVGGAATYARILRGELVETLRMDYVRTAHAKGLAPRTVVVRHALRNALIPIVTLLGLSLPGLVGGAIITEKIFNWPGLGMLTIEAINKLDVPIIMATVLMFGVLVQLGNLLADVTVAALDPRIRVGERG